MGSGSSGIGEWAGVVFGKVIGSSRGGVVEVSVGPAMFPDTGVTGTKTACVTRAEIDEALERVDVVWTDEELPSNAEL